MFEPWIGGGPRMLSGGQVSFLIEVIQTTLAGIALIVALGPIWLAALLGRVGAPASEPAEPPRVIGHQPRSPIGSPTRRVGSALVSTEEEDTEETLVLAGASSPGGD